MIADSLVVIVSRDASTLHAGRQTTTFLARMLRGVSNEKATMRYQVAPAVGEWIGSVAALVVRGAQRCRPEGFKTQMRATHLNRPLTVVVVCVGGVLQIAVVHDLCGDFPPWGRFTLFSERFRTV